MTPCRKRTAERSLWWGQQGIAVEHDVERVAGHIASEVAGLLAGRNFVLPLAEGVSCLLTLGRLTIAGVLEYLHVLTLFSWIPLGLLARAQRDRRGAARILWWLCAGTVLLCGYILYIDFIWSRTVVAPIRVDLVFVVPLTTLTFVGVGLWGLWTPGALAKIAAALLLALSLPTLVVFALQMSSVRHERAKLDLRPSLIYEAQFRNPDTFRNFFGSLDGNHDPRAGHYEAADARSWTSRVIINSDGHFWLLFKCYERVECVFAEADLADKPLPGSFKARTTTGRTDELVVSAWSQDRLTLSIEPNRGTDTFVRAPVPYRAPAATPGAVAYLGAFAQTRVQRDVLYLVQLWLWQSGDRWLAYFVRTNARCGSTNDFVSASAYEGKPVSDRIDFTPAGEIPGTIAFRIRPLAPASEHLDGQIFFRGKLLENVALERSAILHSPVYESAPLSDLKTTTAWLETVSKGYFMRWQAACSEDGRAEDPGQAGGGGGPARDAVR